MSESSNQDIISIWRTFLEKIEQAWVVFEHGTVVICSDPEENPEVYAVNVLQEWGPVVAGTPLGDFTVQDLAIIPGWLVFYAHPDIANYVSPDEAGEQEASHVSVGFIGRKKRQLDAETLKVLHIRPRE
ncbi:MAG: hypothetical protein ACFE7R_03985 [Candidatus Hodarchaeota archaeon]